LEGELTEGENIRKGRQVCPWLFRGEATKGGAFLQLSRCRDREDWEGGSKARRGGDHATEGDGWGGGDSERRREHRWRGNNEPVIGGAIGGLAGSHVIKTSKLNRKEVIGKGERTEGNWVKKLYAYQWEKFNRTGIDQE